MQKYLVATGIIKGAVPAHRRPAEGMQELLRKPGLGSASINVLFSNNHRSLCTIHKHAVHLGAYEKENKHEEEKGYLVIIEKLRF